MQKPPDMLSDEQSPSQGAECSTRTLQGYTLQLGKLGPSELFQCLNPTDGQSNAWPYIPKSFMKTEGVGF